MGTFNVAMRVGDLSKTSLAEVEALADTGSIHSCIPQDILESVNVQPTETRSFAFADERVVDMPFGYVMFELSGLEVIAPVIFAEEGTGAILGATTLEAAHLIVDSVNERLTPVLPMGRFGNGDRSTSR